MESLGSVEKAIDVLFHLHRQPGAQGVTAIGRALGMPKSSVHRLLAALARRELVERDERGRYRPGIGLVALGLGALAHEPVVLAARAVLEACEQIQEARLVDGVIRVQLAPGVEEGGLIARLLVTAGIGVVGLTAEKVRLDEAFLHLTKGLVQ